MAQTRNYSFFKPNYAEDKGTISSPSNNLTLFQLDASNSSVVLKIIQSNQLTQLMVNSNT